MMTARGLYARTPDLRLCELSRCYATAYDDPTAPPEVRAWALQKARELKPELDRRLTILDVVAQMEAIEDAPDSDTEPDA